MYYKILNSSLKNREFQYQIGENIYPSLFQPGKGQGGFYVCEKKHIGYWLQMYRDPIVCEAILKDDAEIYPIRHALKTNHIVLQNPLPIREFLKANPNLENIIVQQDGRNLEYIHTPLRQTCVLAFKQNGRAIQFLKNPSYPLCLLALRQNGRAIQYIKNPSLLLAAIAYKQNNATLQIIQKKNPKITAQVLEAYTKLHCL